jgi:hypothetical protein
VFSCSASIRGDLTWADLACPLGRLATGHLRPSNRSSSAALVSHKTKDGEECFPLPPPRNFVPGSSRVASLQIKFRRRSVADLQLTKAQSLGAPFGIARGQGESTARRPTTKESSPFSSTHR